MMCVCSRTLAALLWLFAAACCAPAGQPVHDACVDVRRSSLELNDIAHTVSIEARNGSKDVTDFTTALVWMEAKDMCDPETLKQKSETCLGKMLDVLTSYRSAVERLAGFESCSESVIKVTNKLHKLHQDMSKCVRSKKSGTDHQKESNSRKEDIQPVDLWEEALLCHYTMDRLFSFSIFTARVFAVGDPAHHTEGSAQRCM
ncbi:uncharacterized protein LOC119490069 [Sebastes umbrosus]|uniref:uncharacterized protein LOC119490069 n=1 Tax=Sebastes umbrosus TaxID=72105 RepID=UPI0018A028D8|nr:uncharacterized protein LOC119490069 [Sebastes umbrosus]